MIGYHNLFSDCGNKTLQQHIIKKGLELPITGHPKPTIHQGPAVTRVALIGDDYVGMRPTLAVQVGDSVKKGQVVFEDKKTVGVKYTAPASGTVVEINRVGWPVKMLFEDFKRKYRCLSFDQPQLIADSVPMAEQCVNLLMKGGLPRSGPDG